MLKTILGVSLATAAAFVFMALQTGLISTKRPLSEEELAEVKAVAAKKVAPARARFPEDLAPAARAQPVAAAADFAVANKPHKLAMFHHIISP